MALGVILTPYGANGPGWYAETGSAYGGKGTYLPQPGKYPIVDRFHNTRGEVGWYYDTQLGRAGGLGWIARLKSKLGLGAIPTDAELVNVNPCYTPVASGWINTEQGYITPPWRFGWDPAGAYGPPTSLGGASMSSYSTLTHAVALLAGAGIGIWFAKRKKK